MYINFIHISQLTPLICIAVLLRYALVFYSNLSLSPWERKKSTCTSVPTLRIIKPLCASEFSSPSTDTKPLRWGCTGNLKVGCPVAVNHR